MLIYKDPAHRPGLSNQWIRLWFVPHTIYPYSLAALLLGAVNIEQSKLLDFDDLRFLLGQIIRIPHRQRLELGRLAMPETVESLIRFNAEEVNAFSVSDFYYDPHTKHYTGMQKVLKGWCSGIRLADKALHMDFIHTCEGYPVYLIVRVLKISSENFAKEVGRTYLAEQ